jgi:hypothetical protein
MPRPIYHITHIDNLPGILQTQGLWCDAERIRQGFRPVGIAHQDLKDRRARTPVRRRSGVIVAAGGTLADYVPFYFANRSPMLFSIHTGFVAGYTGGQSSVIYLVSSAERMAAGNRPWCFTNGHAVEALTDFFDTPEESTQVDWSVIGNWSWKNTDADPDRKRRKQAEFLVHGSVHWSSIESIGVIDAATKSRVEQILAHAGVFYHPSVEVQRKWYYLEK